MNRIHVLKTEPARVAVLSAANRLETARDCELVAGNAETASQLNFCVVALYALALRTEGRKI